MLPKWLKSPRRTYSLPNPPESPRNFSCSSFKDIQNILKEESQPQPESPKRPSIFHRVRISTSILRIWAHRNVVPLSPSITLPNANQRSIVLYFTSLRVVRRTFEDCRIVRSILRGFRVPIDERDLSMDANFLCELQGIIGCKTLTLPRVFIGGRYVGGVEEIKQMHESEELKKLIAVLPFVEPAVCDICGGHGFVVCEECNGSHKIYSAKSGFKTCPVCNVNGLIRCPSCCSVLRRCS